MLLHSPVYEVERKERTPIDQSYKRNAIVDDDSVLLSVISDMLRKLGHTPINCHNPDEFEKLAKQADMILTDMEMGEISGQDILQRSSTTPVVIMTARADFSLELAKDLRFSNYLPKPFSIEDLYTLFGGKYIKADKESYSTDIKPVTMAESAENRVCFPMLEDMFENDYEAIRDILTTFDIATYENIEKLRDCLSKDDFSGCQAICHKMLPMFAQLEAHESVVILKRMDSLRGSTQDKHPEWKNDIEQLIPQAENLRSIVKTY